MLHKFLKLQTPLEMKKETFIKMFCTCRHCKIFKRLNFCLSFVFTPNLFQVNFTFLFLHLLPPTLKKLRKSSRGYRKGTLTWIVLTFCHNFFFSTPTWRKSGSIFNLFTLLSRKLRSTSIGKKKKKHPRSVHQSHWAYLIVFPNSFWANVPILYPLKTLQNLWFYGVFKGNKMETSEMG